jgi:broad specificity phosphatase PhoE
VEIRIEPYFPELAQVISTLFPLYFQNILDQLMKHYFLLFSFLLILSACTAQNSPKTIYIVRHAEKQLEGKDPELAYVGEVRAKKLAQILEKEAIKRVLSTDYTRTRNTAQPTAAAAGLVVEYYDPKNQEALVADLRASEGNILVVGHSNTVSQLANAFIDKGEKFADLTDLEYDYIYVVTLDKKGAKVERKTYKDF